MVFVYDILLTGSVLPPIPTTGLTAADVPSLVNKTRNQMLAALHEISLSASAAPASPTPLLAGELSEGYGSTGDEQDVEEVISARNGEAVEADLVGAVAGANGPGGGLVTGSGAGRAKGGKGDGTQGEGERGKKYAIA